MRKTLKIIIGVVIIAVFAGTIIYLYNTSKEDTIVYQNKSPFFTNIVNKTVATGEVVPRKEIEIKPQVSGIVHRLFVVPGDEVQEGDLIARVKIIPNMVSLNNATTRLNKAKITLNDTRQAYERQKKVYEKGVIPEAEFQRYEVDYMNSREELEAAENNLQLIKEGAIKEAGENSNTLIRSTIDGMVLDVPVEKGNSVIESNNFNDGTTIASVADMSDMIFKGKVDETEVGRLKPGMDLELQIGAINEERFHAVLEYIAPKGVEENGAVQFEIKATVNLKKDQFIRAGYSANANIVLQKKDSVLAIPESLLQFKGDTTYVEVQTEPNIYEKRYPEFGISDGINIEVIEGLSEEDNIKDPTRREKTEQS